MKDILIDSNLVVYIALATSVFTLIFSIVQTFKIKNTRYDFENNRVHIDDFRKYHESQIYAINKKMMNTEPRIKDIYHLLLQNGIINDYENYSTVRLNSFLISNGINQTDLIIDKKSVFVLTPFHPEHDKEYKIISETCNQVGLKCTRGDEEYYDSDIFPQVLKQIVKARIIIANLNGRNPNVLYELGIAQALGKTTILISKSPEKIPVDLKSKRFIFYSSYKDLSEALKINLIRTLS